MACCWAHVRRKFFDAQQNHYAGAEMFLTLIRQLYQIEATAKTRSEAKFTETALYNERKIARRDSAKIVKEFFDVCEKTATTEIPSSLLGKAANYALKLRVELSNFLSNPKLNIDNNPALSPALENPQVLRIPA